MRRAERGRRQAGGQRWAWGGAALGLLLLGAALWPARAPQEISRRVAGSGAPALLARAAPPPPIVPPAALPLPPSARRAVARHTPDYRLDAPPSVSAAQIDAVLAAYRSPAAGQGREFYDRGVAAGIDPAYPLAFFVVESAAGTQGVARVTHGIGNIRWTPGYAAYAGYRRYPTFAAGIADWYTLIRTLYLDTWGLHTPATILPRYAPAGDHNNPVRYAATVEQLVDSWGGSP